MSVPSLANTRLQRLRRALRDHEVDALLLSNVTNIRWLTGFSGSFAFAFASQDDAWLAVDSRYQLQASRECPAFALRQLTSSAADNLAELLAETGQPSVGVEADHLTVAAFEKYQRLLDGRVVLKPVAEVVRKLRGTKDEAELAAIRHACSIVDEVFAYACDVMKPGMSERDLMLEIEWRMRKQHGAEVAFPTIAVSGPRTALPHGQPSDRMLQHGDLVTLDFGARWQGYCSDITRTVALGRASDEQRRIHQTVLEAQRRAIEVMRPGVDASAVDSAARDHIGNAGHGPHFGHGLGHSVGLEVHDGLGMNQRSDWKLEPGMVLTVEPGIYLEDWGGVRIEDDVLVTQDGVEVLTSAPRELLEL